MIFNVIFFIDKLFSCSFFIDQKEPKNLARTNLGLPYMLSSLPMYRDAPLRTVYNSLCAI